MFLGSVKDLGSLPKSTSRSKNSVADPSTEMELNHLRSQVRDLRKEVVNAKTDAKQNKVVCSDRQVLQLQEQLAHSKRQLDQAHSENETLLGRLEDGNNHSERAELEKNLAQAKMELDHEKSNHMNTSEAFAGARAELSQTQSELSNARKQIETNAQGSTEMDLLKEECRTLHQEVERLTGQVDCLTGKEQLASGRASQGDTAILENESLKKRLVTSQENVTNLQKEVAILKAPSSGDVSQNEMEQALRTECAGLHTDIEKLKQQLDEQTAKAQYVVSPKKATADVQAQNANLKSQVDSFSSQVQDLTNQLSRTQSELSTAKQMVESKNSDLHVLQQEREILEDSVRHAEETSTERERLQGEVAEHIASKQELERQISQKEQENNQLKEKLQQAKEFVNKKIEEYSKKAEAAQEMAGSLNSQLATVSRELETERSRSEACAKKCERLEQELGESDAKIKHLNLRSEQSATSSETHVRQRAEMKDQVVLLQNEVSAKRALVEEHNRCLEDQKDELKAKDILVNTHLGRVRELESEISTLQEKITQTEQRNEELLELSREEKQQLEKKSAAGLVELESQIKNLKQTHQANVDGLESQLADARAELEAAQSASASAQPIQAKQEDSGTALKDSQEKTEQLQKQLQEKDEQIQAIKEKAVTKLNDLKAALESATQAKSILEEQLASKEKEINEIAQKLHHFTETDSKNTDEMAKRAQELREELEDTRNLLAAKSDAAESLTRRVSQLEKDAADREDEQVVSTLEAAEAIREDLETSQKEKGKLETSLSQVQTTLSHVESSLAEKDKELLSITTQFQELQSAIEKFEQEKAASREQTHAAEERQKDFEIRVGTLRQELEASEKAAEDQKQLAEQHKIDAQKALQNEISQEREEQKELWSKRLHDAITKIELKHEETVKSMNNKIQYAVTAKLRVEKEHNDLKQSLADQQENHECSRELSNLEEIPEGKTAAAAPDKTPPRQREVEAAAAAATTFELKFALTGPLGIEFNEFEYPYIVSKVHEGKVASSFDIRPNDELISVKNEILTEKHDWESMVKLLSERPVAVVFKRPPAGSSSVTGSGSGWMSSMTSALNTSTISSGLSKGMSMASDLATPYHQKMANKKQANKDEEIKFLRQGNSESLQVIDHLTQERDAIQKRFDEMKNALVGASANEEENESGEDSAEHKKRQIKVSGAAVVQYASKIEQLEKEKNAIVKEAELLRAQDKSAAEKHLKLQEETLTQKIAELEHLNAGLKSQCDSLEVQVTSSLDKISKADKVITNY